jgi:hypothetical protein
VFYAPGEFATQMGHIYSELGLKEYRISAMCEWCFDEVTDIKIILAQNAQD